MSGEISGPGGHALVGMLLLEHQRQLTKEGKINRDAAHEVGIAAKKVGLIYDEIDESAKKWEKTMQQVDLAMSAYSAGQTAVSMPGQIESANAMSSMPEPERAKAMENWETNWKNQGKDLSAKEQLKEHAWNAVGHVSTVGQEQMQRDDEADKKSSAAMEQFQESSLELVEKSRTLSEKEQEVAVEAYKIGGVFTRQG